MTEEKPQGPKTNWLGIVVGLGVSGLALGILFYLVDFEQAWQSLKLADFRVLPVVIACFFGTLVTRSIAWRTILQEKISLWKTFLTINEGYLFNNVLPFRLGELARAFILSKTSEISFWEVLSTIMVERIFDVSLLAVLLLSTVPFVIGAEWAMQSAVVTGILVVVGLVVLFLAARSRDAAIGLFERLTKPWPRLTDFGREKLVSVLDGLSALREPKRFIKAFGWLAVAWIFNILWYTILLWAFVPGAKFLWSAFTVGVVSLGVSAPSSPGYVGVFEAAQMAALSIFGIEESVIFAYAVTAHLIYLVITILIGAFALSRDGQSLGDVYRGIQFRRSVSKEVSE